MSEIHTDKKVFIEKLKGKRRKGKPSKRCIDDIEEDLKKKEWRKVIKEAEYLQGL
ncbi:hypothetical protein C0J52_20354 [Blattella germanica]|nr:hypothetical protein C0J52_20354 [Blattella germanica]